MSQTKKSVNQGDMLADCMLSFGKIKGFSLSIPGRFLGATECSVFILPIGIRLKNRSAGDRITDPKNRFGD